MLLARRYVYLLPVETTANTVEMCLIQTTKIGKVRDNCEKLHRRTGVLQQWQGFDFFYQQESNPIDPAVPVLDLSPLNGVVLILAKVITQSNPINLYLVTEDYKDCSYRAEESRLSACLPLQFRSSRSLRR